jgi:hypothetical protein
MCPTCCAYAAKWFSIKRLYSKILRYTTYKMCLYSATYIIYVLCAPSYYMLSIGVSSISISPIPIPSWFHASLPVFHDILRISTWAYFASVITVGLPFNVYLC